MDASVRQRSLASLDLFLESARQQLKSLMEDKPIDAIDKSWWHMEEAIPQSNVLYS